MYFEVTDAHWFEAEGINSDIETVTIHYEKLNINPEFYIYLFNLCRKDFKGITSISCPGSDYIIGLYPSNELICVVHGDYARLIYFHHAGEFLYFAKTLFDIKFHEYPELIELADSIYYDQYLLDKFINKS